MGLYIRLRGKVSGPFADEALRLMARQGRLTPFHEVSADGVHWRSARDAGYAGSAPVPIPPPPPAFEVGRTVLGQPAPEPVPLPLTRTMLTTEGGGAWYYEAGGAQNGPVDDAELLALAEGGRVRPGDLVWEQGQGDWLPLERSRLAGRLPARPAGTSVPVGYAFCGLALACPPLGLLGAAFGVMNLRDRDRARHGVAQLCLAVACAAAGSFLWLLIWHAALSAE